MTKLPIDGHQNNNLKRPNVASTPKYPLARVQWAIENTQSMSPLVMHTLSMPSSSRLNSDPLGGVQLKRSKCTTVSLVVSLFNVSMLSQYYPSSSYTLERRAATLESWILPLPSCVIGDARAIDENTFGSSSYFTSASQCPPLGKRQLSPSALRWDFPCRVTILKSYSLSKHSHQAMRTVRLSLLNIKTSVL